MEAFPFEYALFLKFKYEGNTIRVLNYKFPRQRVSKNSFEVLDYSPVLEGYEGILHKHLLFPHFSPRDSALLKSYPLNLLAFRGKLVRASWRGTIYKVG